MTKFLIEVPHEEEHAACARVVQIFLNTGFAQPGRPSLGSWVIYGLGSETQELPAFVVISVAAVPILVTMAQRKRLFGGARLRALKECSVDALVRVATPKAAAAIRDAAQNGDRALKKIAVARSSG